MKKIFFLLLLFSSILVNAQYTYQIVARNLTAPDNTTSANIIGSGAAFHNLTWNVSGTVSGCSVRIDGSTDGITWGTGDVIGATTCTSNGNVLSTSHVVNYVRINLVTLTGAGATFTANASGYITQPSGGGTLTSLTCGTGITCSPGSPITSTGTISTSSNGPLVNKCNPTIVSDTRTTDGTFATTCTISGLVIGSRIIVDAVGVETFTNGVCTGSASTFGVDYDSTTILSAGNSDSVFANGQSWSFHGEFILAITGASGRINASPGYTVKQDGTAILINATGATVAFDSTVSHVLKIHLTNSGTTCGPYTLTQFNVDQLH